MKVGKTANADHTLKCDAVMKERAVASNRHKVREKIFVHIFRQRRVECLYMLSRITKRERVKTQRKENNKWCKIYRRWEGGY